MNFSAPFIRRPVGTTLLAIGLFLTGAVAYRFLPVASLPTFRKSNPAAMPVLILALTSSNVTPSAIFDAADSVIVQRISQLPGVGEVTVSGADQPALRVRVNPGAIAAAGISLEDVRLAIV